MHELRDGELIDGRYQVRGLLGRGGTADVVRCLDLEFKQEVALKILSLPHRSSAEYRRRLRLEAELATSILHPNVVEILGTGETPDGDPYLIMEVLEGETLRELIDREGALGPEIALPLVQQAAAGLAAAHREGIVHRDVKPSNLFLCGPRNAPYCLKVFDFGFARGKLSSKSSHGNVLGTLEYMAPEQIVGEPADARADIYSLGVVLFRLLTKELPFDLASDKDMLAHQLISPAPPPSWLVDGLDARIDTVALTAMRKCPMNRYATMLDMIADLTRLARDEAVAGAPLVVTPDRYTPRSELGQEALKLLRQRHGHPPLEVVLLNETSSSSGDEDEPVLSAELA